MNTLVLPAKDLLMRYTPAAAALALLAAVTSSVGYSAPREDLSPRAVALLEQGRAAMDSGEYNAAVDAYEAALVVEPGNARVLIDLAEASRHQGMQGKALHYYREALQDDPRNLSAIAGEGEALVEKGAVAKAERNLARLKGLCGSNCDATRQLAAAIAKGPAPKMVTADAVTPDPVITEN
jgi:cytochrome c-type biogenesis protein CcmH/NrfG